MKKTLFILGLVLSLQCSGYQLFSGSEEIPDRGNVPCFIWQGSNYQLQFRPPSNSQVLWNPQVGEVSMVQTSSSSSVRITEILPVAETNVVEETKPVAASTNALQNAQLVNRGYPVRVYSSFGPLEGFQTEIESDGVTYIKQDLTLRHHQKTFQITLQFLKADLPAQTIAFGNFLTSLRFR